MTGWGGGRWIGGYAAVLRWSIPQDPVGLMRAVSLLQRLPRSWLARIFKGYGKKHACADGQRGLIRRWAQHDRHRRCRAAYPSSQRNGLRYGHG